MGLDGVLQQLVPRRVEVAMQGSAPVRLARYRHTVFERAQAVADRCIRCADAVVANEPFDERRRAQRTVLSEHAQNRAV
jgi:hypothetical protein